MKTNVAIANEAIVKAMTVGKRVVWGKIGEFYIVTLEPFYMAYILREKEVYFSLDKAQRNGAFEKAFGNLLDLEKTVKEENRIRETGAYYSIDGRTFLKEFKSDRGAVWVNTKFLKDAVCVSFYQESAETADKTTERLPVLVTDGAKPARIILPALKL